MTEEVLSPYQTTVQYPFESPKKVLTNQHVYISSFELFISEFELIFRQSEHKIRKILKMYGSLESAWAIIVIVSVSFNFWFLFFFGIWTFFSA